MCIISRAHYSKPNTPIVLPLNILENISFSTVPLVFSVGTVSTQILTMDFTFFNPNSLFYVNGTHLRISIGSVKNLAVWLYKKLFYLFYHPTL